MKKILDTNLKVISTILIVIGFLITFIFSSYGIGTALIEVIMGYIGAIILMSGLLLFVYSFFKK